MGDRILHEDDDDEAVTVTCCRCATVFEGMWPTQASGCAADVHEEGIYGHYGSAVCDMTRLLYTSGVRPEALVPGQQVCDPCLEEMIAEGLLKEDDYQDTSFADAATADIGAHLDEFEEILEANIAGGDPAGETPDPGTDA